MFILVKLWQLYSSEYSLPMYIGSRRVSAPSLDRFYFLEWVKKDKDSVNQCLYWWAVVSQSLTNSLTSGGTLLMERTFSVVRMDETAFLDVCLNPWILWWEISKTVWWQKTGWLPSLAKIKSLLRSFWWWGWWLGTNRQPRGQIQQCIWDLGDIPKLMASSI